MFEAWININWCGYLVIAFRDIQVNLYDESKQILKVKNKGEPDKHRINFQEYEFEIYLKVGPVVSDINNLNRCNDVDEIVNRDCEWL